MKILCCFVVMVAPLLAAESPDAGMKSAALALLGTLDAGQRERATFKFSDDDRLEFRYTPRERSGLIYKELSKQQREAVHRLLATALSDEGMLKAQQVMALEGVLAELENRPEFRDPEKYFISIFGTPGDAAGWGWKFEGHHLSLNYTLTGNGQVAVTPSFFGSNPAEVRQGKHKDLRVLADEEDLAKKLLTLLLDGKRPEVVFSAKAPAEILSGEQRVTKALEPVGVAAAGMNDAQLAALIELVSEYLLRHRKELAGADMAAIRAAGMGKVHFGWAGGSGPGEAWYYRIQGPSFLMEAANSQNHANHIHTVWRSFDGDFGRDLLGDHFRDHKH